MTEQRTAWGWGLASIDAAGNTLDVWYPELTLGEAPAETSRPNHNFGAIAHDEADARGVRRMPVFTVSKLDEPIEDAADAYLRLHLLSMRLAKPNTLNLDGIFAKLNNVVWTNYGPFAVDDFALRKLDVMAATRQSGAVLAPHVDVNVLSIDKFPRMVDYVVPTGVRIGDADRVRLGAHLSEGTTVMHAGFVNFNAGTLGVSMVEGRVSQGVVVGNGSDIGGGASIKGTRRGLANLPHTHFVERNVDLSLQPVLRVVCGASVAHQCDGTHVWRHGLIMVEFDVSGHASPLSAGCLSDLLPVCHRIRIAGTAHTKTCLPQDFREGTFR